MWLLNDVVTESAELRNWFGRVDNAGWEGGTLPLCTAELTERKKNIFSSL